MSSGAFGGCPTCTCCLGMRAEVTAFDVVRLVDALGVAPVALVEPSPASVDDETSFYLDTSGRAHIPVLRRLPDPHRCSLLVGPLGDRGGATGGTGGEYRCGVYPVRPLVCRAYPFELDRGALALRDPVRCPAGAWDPSPAVDRAWRPDLLRQVAETDAQRWLVRRWNERVLFGLTDQAEHADAAPFEEHLAWTLGVARAALAHLDALVADGACTAAWAAALDGGASPLDPRFAGAPPEGALAPLAPWWDGLQALATRLRGEPHPTS